MQTKRWRHLWHLVGGSFFPVISLFIPRQALLTTTGSITAVFVLWEATRLTKPVVNRWMVSHLGVILKTSESRRLTGTTCLLIATLTAFLAFNKYIAIACLLFVSVGDLLATIVGEKFGKRRLFQKSLEGSLACLSACLAIGLVMTFAVGFILLPIAIVGAAVATASELAPLPIDDNIAIPLLSGGAMTLADALAKT